MEKSNIFFAELLRRYFAQQAPEQTVTCRMGNLQQLVKCWNIMVRIETMSYLTLTPRQTQQLEADPA